MLAHDGEKEPEMEIGECALDAGWVDGWTNQCLFFVLLRCRPLEDLEGGGGGGFGFSFHRESSEGFALLRAWKDVRFLIHRRLPPFLFLNHPPIFFVSDRFLPCRN